MARTVIISRVQAHNKLHPGSMFMGEPQYIWQNTSGSRTFINGEIAFRENDWMCYVDYNGNLYGAASTDKKSAAGIVFTHLLTVVPLPPKDLSLRDLLEAGVDIETILSITSGGVRGTVTFSKNTKRYSRHVDKPSTDVYTVVRSIIKEPSARIVLEDMMI